MSAHASPNIITDGLVFLYDTDDGKSYKGEPTTNLITSNGIDFSTFSSYNTLIRSRVSDSNSPSGYACEMEYPDGGVNTASRIRFGDSTNIPTSGNAFVSIMAKFQGGPSSNITPRVYSGSSWQTLAPLDGGSAYLTSEYRRFGVYAYLGTGSGGPLPAFSMTQNNSNNQVGQKTRWHSPQVELKTHATPFVDGTRSATQGLIDRTGNSTIDLSPASYDSNAQITFDGTDDYITAGNPTELQFIYSDPFSLEVWIKADDLSGFNHVIGKTYGNYRLSVTSSGYSFRLDSNNLTTNAGTPVVGEWQHVVATWEPSTSTARVYVNGVLEQSVTDATVDWTYTSANFQLGNSPGENYHFNGTIPAARVYSKTVTSAEVLQSYNATKDRFIR